MISKNKEFIIVDTEFTAWEGSMQRNWQRPNEYRELVQISAIKINNLEITDSINIYIKPTFNPKLSDYFTNLTGITNEIIDEKGIDVYSAIKTLHKFCGRNEVFSYGNDWEIIYENLHLNLIEEKVLYFWQARWHDVCDFFAQYNVDTQKYTSGTVYKISNKCYHADVHNAAWDTQSIFIAIKFLLNS